MATVRFPISLRLTFWYGLSLLLLLSLFGAFLYVGFHVGLHSELEREMDRAREIILPSVDVQSPVPSLRTAGEFESLGDLAAGTTGTYVRLLSVSGEILYTSPNFADQRHFDPAIPPQPEGAVRSHVWEGVLTRSGYSPVFDEAGAQRAWLEITRRESTIHNELHRLQWLLVAGGIFGMIMAVGAGYWLAKNALKPVALLTEAANRIQSGDLSTRLPTDFRVQDELSDLADTFNRMLERIRVTFDRERQFRADATHELFTPLSGLQNEIDVALQKPREDHYYVESLRAARGHVERMGATIDGLLELSRLESLENPDSRPIDVGSCIADRLRDLESMIAAAGLDLEIDIQPASKVCIDRKHLEVIIDNLVENAVKYTPRGGHVSVRTVQRDGYVGLTVQDTGIGFDPDESDVLFERFFRSDTPAVQRTKGSGLGLSIVKTLVEMYQGTIAATSKGPNSGSKFEIRFPSLDASSSR